MKKVFLALTLVACLPLYAQLSYNTVTATINDPAGNPYANAGYTISLANNQGLPVTSASTPNGQLFNAQPVTGNLDAAGRFSVKLVPNTILSKPSGTQWKFVVTPPADAAILTYSEAWSLTYQTAISGDVDLSAQLSAVARPVNYTNLKTGQSTMSGTDTIARVAAAGANSTANAAQTTANAAQTTANAAQATAAAAQATANAAVPLAGGTMTGPLITPTAQGSVNAVLFVKAPPYNAKCDGVQDDQSSATNGNTGSGIQGAFTDALPGSTNPLCTATGCSVQFPAGKCLTSTIVWKGQSFFGAGRRTSLIIGKPGQDVFQVPNSTGTWIYNASIRGLSIYVDVTVNASAAANKVTGATVASGGSGGTNGTQTVTGTTGIGTKFQALVTVSGGTITAVNSITVQGYYTTNPDVPDPVSGAGLTGAALSLTLAATGGNNAFPDRVAGTVQGIDNVARDGVTNGIYAITSWSITSNVVTFQTSGFNAPVGAVMTLSGFPTSTFFNARTVTVLAGVSSTQFTAAFTHADGSATETGSTSTPTVTSATLGFAINGATLLTLQITYPDLVTESIRVASVTNATTAVLLSAPTRSQTGVKFTLLKGFDVPIAPAAPVFGVAPCGSPASGASATAGTKTVALNCNFPFSMTLVIDPALIIGTPITITGAGAGGADFHSTITGYDPVQCDGHHTTGCTLTVADNIGTTVTKAPGSFLNPHTPPWYIGNAGLALPCSNQSACYLSAYGLTIQDVEFFQYPGSSLLYSNHAAGIFTQMPLYAARLNNLHFWSLYGGLIEASPLLNAAASTADTSSFMGMDFSNDLLPLVTYNGNNRVLSEINFYQETPLSMGPFFLASHQLLQAPALWALSSIYDEGGPATAGEWARFIGGMQVASAGIGGANSTQSWIEVTGGTGMNWKGIVSGGSIHVDASNYNTFTNSPVPAVDKGYGNSFESDYNSNNYYQGRKFFNGSKPPRSSVGLIDGSFLLSGSSAAPYLNASDLVTTCEDWAVVLSPIGGNPGTCVTDPGGTEITDFYYHSTNATSVLDLGNNGGTAGAWSGVPRTFGANIPQAKINFLLLMRCVGAGCTASGTLLPRDQTTGSATGFPTVPLSLTSSWTVIKIPYDLTGTIFGNVLGLRWTWTSNTGTNWDMAFVAIQPIPADFVTKGTATLTTAAIAAGQCGTTVTVPATGVSALNTIHYSYAAVIAANPGTLIVNAWPTVNNVNFNLCNPTAASVTPSSAVLNWEVRQ